MDRANLPLPALWTMNLTRSPNVDNENSLIAVFALKLL